MNVVLTVPGSDRPAFRGSGAAHRPDRDDCRRGPHDPGAQALEHGDQPQGDRARPHHAKPAPREGDDLKAFDTFLKGSGPRCGQIRDAQRDYLFGKETDEIGSAALIPLGSQSDIGFLAIGSADSERFHPGMSIDFLSRLGQLVAEALKRY